MLNHRLLDPPREPEKFVKKAVEFLQNHATNKKVFCALSGGIDSSATYLLLKEAEIETIPVFIDHGLMRIIRGKEEREHIKKLFPNVLIVDIREKFLPKILGEEDAEVKRKFILKGINFESGSATISNESYKILDEVVESLYAYPEVKIEIRGYTDNTGSRATNMRLSQQRAESVLFYLIGKGISTYRLRARGFGPDDPIAPNNTREGRALNRRIEMVRIDWYLLEKKFNSYKIHGISDILF